MCEGCEAIIPAQTVTCKLCGHVYDRVVSYDTVLPEFEKIVGRIDVAKMVSDKDPKHKDYKIFFDILNKSVTVLKYRGEMSEEGFEKAFLLFEAKVKEWKKEIGKSYTKYDKEFTRLKFFEEVGKIKVG